MVKVLYGPKRFFYASWSTFILRACRAFLTDLTSNWSVEKSVWFLLLHDHVKWASERMKIWKMDIHQWVGENGMEWRFLQIFAIIL